jgi:hypothetical protein
MSKNENVQCVECSTSVDGYACGPCEVILVDNSNAYAMSLLSESLWEQENKFLAQYGEPEVHL